MKLSTLRSVEGDYRFSLGQGMGLTTLRSVWREITVFEAFLKPHHLPQAIALWPNSLKSFA